MNYVIVKPTGMCILLVIVPSSKFQSLDCCIQFRVLIGSFIYLFIYFYFFNRIRRSSRSASLREVLS